MKSQLILLLVLIAVAAATRHGCLTVYEHINRGGRRHTLCSSTSYNQFFRGWWNDRISSVCAGAGARWRLYEHNFSGKSLLINAGQCINIHDRGFNDIVSSVRKYAQVCRNIPVYGYRNRRICRRQRVAPYTKTKVIRQYYNVRTPKTVRRRKTYYKTVCYNKAYRQAYRYPVKRYRNQKVTITVRVREYYTYRVPYATTVRAKKLVTYRHYYNKKVAIRYTKYKYFYRTVKYKHYYTGRCNYRTKYYYYSYSTQLYRTTCTRSAYKWVNYYTWGYKKVPTTKKVWTGHWTGPIHCQKKVYKTVKSTKVIRVKVKRRKKVRYTQRYSCVKKRRIRVRKWKYVTRSRSCRKWTIKTKRVRYRKGVPAIRYVTRRVWKWAKKSVWYNKKVFKYKIVRSYRWGYKGKVVTQRRAYYAYATGYKTAYRVAHKKVAYYKYVNVVVYYNVRKSKLVTRKVANYKYRTQCSNTRQRYVVRYRRVCS